MSNKDKLLEIVSKEKTRTIERNKLRIKYRWFIRLVNRLKLWWLNATDWILKHLNVNNGVLHSVSNCDYCDKETDKLIDENGFNYCEDCYMR